VTPLPIRNPQPYVTRHGQGYSHFEHDTRGIHHELLVSVAAVDPVKFCCLRIRNHSARQRILSVTYFAEWVLGVSREHTQSHIVTRLDDATRALLATNSFHPEFAERVAFMQLLERDGTVTGDRREFLGRNGTWEQPQAMTRARLSGRTGAGLDPCAAIHTRLDLAAGEECEVIFLLGQGDNEDNVRDYLSRYNTRADVHAEIERVRSAWNDRLNFLQVKTPHAAFDILMNRWLLYQVISCRLWARTAFYQCGGAYGFRDQLQDVMAIVHCEPQLAREHILRAARRQYESGDVQHWWHPPTGRGIRTRMSDDALWLPYVVSHYVQATGDRGILDESLPFLISPSLEPQEHERYEFPEVTSQSDSLYRHCVLAIDRSLAFGEHGLPLMGCGDWNDGMNRVGRAGRGESVWLGWFLLEVLHQFLPWIEAKGDVGLAHKYTEKARRLRESIKLHAWDGPDGRWYRRAFFDDGTPLGSRQNDECQIDSVAQSWSVIAGGDCERSRLAMQSVLELLVCWNDRFIQLLTPPFERTSLDPGYIKGYVPGIRENGGQYTHAALWVVQAMAKLGDAEKAMSLFDLLNPIDHAATPQQRED
jgi:cyclic beta-1,2-glucan synthetase